MERKYWSSVLCEWKSWASFFNIVQLTLNGPNHYTGDPWREATVASDYHFRQSTENQPIFVSDGFHCSDLLTEWTVDPTVADVAALGVAYLGRWQDEWRQAHPHVSSASAFSTPNPDTLTKPPPFIPFPIPPSVVNAQPAPLPKSVTQNSTAKPATSHRPSKHHAFANAWDRKFE